MKIVLKSFASLIVTFSVATNVVSCGARIIDVDINKDNGDKSISLYEYLGDTRRILIDTNEASINGSFSEERAIEILQERIRLEIHSDFNKDLFNFNHIYGLVSDGYILVSPKDGKSGFDQNSKAYYYILGIHSEPYVPSVSGKFSWWVIDAYSKIMKDKCLFLKNKYLSEGHYKVESKIYQEYLRRQIQYQMLRVILSKIEVSGDKPEDGELTQGIEIEEIVLDNLYKSLKDELLEETLYDVERIINYAKNFII
ncbi:hypothetical protein SCHIN_v1c03400 [Spiroplasma chinense]|uniref:Lipoprotein n=1 Tax=Spiroplasma chinense TaxID=216932 RepID=A0A5B9Y5J2_9MOLU|nr:hypothetical protein [Spiroplasma chinense]QEH61537.1 hypothetical protein SCHIN_v1c03400 [Spiroplasma chinense]